MGLYQMDLYQDQVPVTMVWAVVATFGDIGTPHLEWFITSEASTEDYQSIAKYLKDKGTSGRVQRWSVRLPYQRMEMADAKDWVERHILHAPQPNQWARGLDIYTKKGKS